jgi:Ca2+-binding RTX toxin-like protein
MGLPFTLRPGTARRRLAVLGVLSLLAFCAQLVLAAPAAAAPFTGGFSPRIIANLADLNGDGLRNGRDDANAFYGDTHIIDGSLDCDAWAAANDGSVGDGVIDGADDCTLVGYDGTADGVTINVVDGAFIVANGRLPTVFNAAQPNNPDVGDSDFAWSAIGGRVDSNGDEAITGDDCHFGLIGLVSDAGLGNATDGADILGSDPSCGFATAPPAANNGLVDLNSDEVITFGGDTCTNNCFFGRDVRRGVVQGPPECPGHAGDPRRDVIGTSGPDILIGTAGADIICAFGGNDLLVGRGGNDLLLGGRGADDLRGRAGADVLRGGPGPDVLRGGTGPDRLFGQRGNDLLFGGGGNDLLDGGPGRDRGVGGSGLDTFVRCESRQQ